jgi:hypothetical protein
MIYFKYRNKRIVYNKLKYMCLYEGHGVSKLNAEVKKEYNITRIYKSFTKVSLSY